MEIQEFLKNIDGIYKTGAATEHSYSSDLQKLLSSIAPDVTALNEPKRVKCGAPDFIVSQGDIVIGHVEAKDIPVGIRSFKDSNKDQQKRYLAALPMGNFARGKNIGLATARSNKNPVPDHFFVVDRMMETKCAESSTQSALFPLYLYPGEQDLDKTRRVNFDQKLYNKLQKMASHPHHGKPDEVQVFDYIYGVLYCPAYREAYAEFLKVDFPRIPWPSTPEEFWYVSAKGAELRKLHLMEPASIGAPTFPFTGEGNNEVDKPRFKDGHIWINDSQYFADAPRVSWDFYIGGYQPAQKWLKDRKGRTLSFQDVKHYQRVLKILSETDGIMQTITMNLTQ